MTLAYYNLAALLASQSHLKEAEEVYRKAIEANPNDAVAYLGLGNLFASQNYIKLAKEAWRKAVYINPHLAQGPL